MCVKSALQLTTEQLDIVLNKVKTGYNLEKVKRRIIHNNALYDSQLKKWRNIPSNSSHEKELYGPLIYLFNAILHRLKKESQRRAFVDTSNTSMQYIEVETLEPQNNIPPLRTSPAISAISLSEYFANYSHITNPTYECCGSPIEVQQEAHADGRLAQCARYAQQCFMRQRGRRFVFVPILSERTVNLYRFDRCGALQSGPIDYHQNPDMLVRIILLVSGVDPIEMGVNPHITWKKHKQYITIQQRAYCVEAGDEVLYWFQGIIGTGKCVWRVTRRGVRLLIKYEWRDVGMAPLWNVPSVGASERRVKKVMGVNVAPVFLHQVDSTVSQLRGFPLPSPDLEAVFLVKVSLMAMYYPTKKAGKGRGWMCMGR